MTPTERILLHLEHVTRNGTGWTACCPAHADRQKSLSLHEADDGKVLLKCFAGCTAKQIMAALGLRLADLFPAAQGGRGGSLPSNSHATTHLPQQSPGHSTGSARTPHLQPSAITEPFGLTLEQYAQAKGVPVNFLQSLGLRTIHSMGAPAVRIPYLAADGTELAIRFRFAMTGDNRFRWRQGAKVALYGLWRLASLRQDSIVLVEGESDCHTLWYHDLSALGIPGAASWQEAWISALDGFHCIYVVCEPDKGGETVQKWLARSAIRDRVRLVTMNGHKDPSALYLDAPARFMERWQEALTAASPWTEHAAVTTAARQQQAWETCQALAAQPQILDLVARDVQRLGVAGETQTVKLLYLVVTSRLLSRPVSATLTGPSSVGKSYLTGQVLQLFPPRAYYALSAMSERALAYSEEPMQHRVLVIYEAAGLKGDFASYLVRSLLSEGRIRYETVEKTPQGLRPRLIEREGPTGLLVTTTEVHLHAENETRLFSLPVTDTQDQTRNVLRAIAQEVREDVELSAWHALQEWLGLRQPAVTIPYAQGLAEAIPPVAVRLRRDFGALLALIRTHALLHQATRQRDAAGRIIATEDDYAVVRALVAPLVAESVEATVSVPIRETVHAVTRLCGAGEETITTAQVARFLHIDKSTALRRVNMALERGYLKNLEERKGRPARLVPGDLLPDEQEILPGVEALHGCRIADGCIAVTTTQLQ